MRPLRTCLSCPSLLALAAVPLFAQAKIEVMGGQGQRNNTAVVLADTSSGFHPLALVTVTYGVPEWKPEYTDKAEEMTKGKMFRLGRDNWPIFDSNVAIKFGNVTVPVGTYYLGISRSKDDATWNLVFIDPARAKAAGAWPPAPEAAPHAFDVPLTHERTEGKITEKLDVNMVNDKTQPTHGTLTIAWGDRKLTSSYDMVLENKAQANEAAGQPVATKSRTFLPGKISMAVDLPSADNDFFTYKPLHALHKDDAVASLTSADQAWSVAEADVQLTGKGIKVPALCMVKCTDGDFHTMYPADFSTKVDLAPGAVVQFGGFGFEVRRSIKAGEHVPVVVGQKWILSIEATDETRVGPDSKPWLVAYKQDSGPLERDVAIEAWRAIRARAGN